MVRIDSEKDVLSLQAIQSNTPELEMLTRSLIKLRQRMKLSNDDKAKLLNLSIKVERRDKEERNSNVNKNSLNGRLREIADLLSFNKFLTYQIKTWEFILDRVDERVHKDIIVAAPTAFGKTESAIPPLVKCALDCDGLILILSPRIALIHDQIKRIGDYNLPNNKLKLGLQMTGIQPKLEWTIYGATQRNQTLNGQKIHRDIDFKTHFKYTFETDLMKVSYVNPNLDEAELLLFSCSCGGLIKSNLHIKPSVYTGGPRGSGTQFLSSSPWKCTNCGKEIELSLSREDHSIVKPNILFTTLNSIESILADPESRDDVRNRLFAVILDEVHTYNSTLGSHASSVIGKLKELKKDHSIIFVGLSATIDSPESFGEKLFGNAVEVFKPDPVQDINRVSDGESYFFMKASDVEKNEFVSYSLKSASFIQFILLSQSSFVRNGERVLAFMDSKDAVSLLSEQTKDAYNHKHLHEFRLDGLINHRNNFIFHSCLGFQPGCERNCTVFKEGECWAKLRDLRQVTTPRTINPLKVTAESLDIDLLSTANLIFSTSELELGMDLPGINHLIQYGATYSIFNYIQRRGRAGRRLGELPNFYFILGDKSNDYLYYSLGSDLISRTYMLPLEPNNTMINKLHWYLDDIYGKAESKYISLMSGRQNNNNYVFKFRSTWEVLKSEAKSPFLNFLEQELQLNLASLSTMTDYSSYNQFKSNNKKLVDVAIQDYRNRINNLLLDGLTPIQYIERERVLISAEIDSSSLTSNEKETILKELEEKFSAVISDLELVGQNNPNQRTHQVDLLNFLNGLSIMYLGTNISKISGQTYSKINNFANSQNLSQAQDSVRELFMKIRSLFELSVCVSRTLNSEVIKYFLRSQYFYMLANQINTISSVASVDLIFPPESLFTSSNAQFILYVNSQSDDDKSCDINDAIYKYFPFRLNESGDEYKNVALPDVRTEGNHKVFDVPSVMDGINFTHENGSVLFPRSLRVDRIKLLDSTNNIVEFCFNCIKFYSNSTGYCPICHKKLKPVRPYSTPIVDVSIDFGTDIMSPLPNVEFSKNSLVTVLLTGVDLDIQNCYYDNDFDAYMPGKGSTRFPLSANRPYGYSTNAHSIRLTIDSDKILNLLNQYQSQNPERGWFGSSDVLHTIAHLWVKTISATTGISPDEFVYKVEAAASMIVISEKQEGGAGYLLSFVDYLNFATKRVLSDMGQIVNCEENRKNYSSQLRQTIYKELDSIYRPGVSLSSRSTLVDMISNQLQVPRGEVVENYPTCFDGCNFCISLPSCELGDSMQLEQISRMIAQWYYEGLVLRTKDRKKVAELSSKGGILVEDQSSNGGEFGVFFI